jgi:hypothetical protein
MSTASGFVLLVELCAIPRVTLPVDSVAGLRRILIETFPPNSVLSSVVNNIGEDGVLHSCVESVGVGVEVSTGSNAEETVLGVNCPKSSVLADTEPSDIVAYAPYLIALLGVVLGRNEHCEVGFTASRGECSANILCFAVRSLNAEDKHMLSHPAFLATKVGSDTQSEALLAEQNVSAVTGVNGPDGVVLGEVADVTIFFVDVSASVQTLDIVSGIAQSFKNIGANASHNQHIENDVDGVGKLDAVFSKG